MKNSYFRFSMATAVLAVCGAVAPAFGLVPQQEQDVIALKPGVLQVDDSGVASYVFVERVETDDKAANKEVKVEVVDGKPRVWVNGEEVPADQLHNQDGRVIVMDENGDVLQSVRIFADGQHRMRFRGAGGMPGGVVVGGEPGGMMWRTAVAEGEAPPVMLGVYMENPGEALRRHLNLAEGKTTLIAGIYEGLPAQKAGLEEYDIILSVNGSDDASPSNIRELLKDRAEGDTLDLQILHNGKRKSLTVRLEKYDAEAMAAAAVHGEPAKEPFGELIFPGRSDDEHFVAIPRKRALQDFDHENIDRVVREALEQALRSTEGIRREAPAMLHEHLNAGHDELERRMEQLHRHIERIEELIREFQEDMHDENEDD